MSRMIRVIHGIDDLADDLRAIPTKSATGLARAVRSNAEQGNRIARNFARESAGAHGKHYHKAFSTEMTGPTSGEYGPDSAMPQGGMSFERGSRNQPPHHDIADAADRRGADDLQLRAQRVLDRLFWP